MKATRFYTLLALLLMAGGIHLQAQLRIDWQQTYGGQLPNCDDEAWVAISVNKLQGTGS